MNHERDGLHHIAPPGSVCKFVHQLGNQVLLCNVRGQEAGLVQFHYILCSQVCYGNGEENEVIPKSYSSQDTSWTGMLKYAWSG